MRSSIIMLLFSLCCCMSLRAQKLVTIYRGGIALIPTYTTLDSAVKAATDGDSIVLSPHVFNETIIFIRNSIKICGTHLGAARTVVDAKGRMGPIFSVFNTTVPLVYRTVIFKDIEIRNGNHYSGFAPSPAEYIISGGGIFAAKGTGLILEGNTRIYGNKSSYSIEWKYSTMAPGKGYGGAIYSEGDVTLRGTSEIFDNEADFFGGIVCQGKLVMEDSSNIHNNDTKTSCAAVWARTAVVRGAARISNNDSGGINVADSLLLEDNAEIYGNEGIAVVCNSFYPSYAGFAECRDQARIHHNNGIGLYCIKAYLHDHSRIDSNNGVGLQLCNCAASWYVRRFSFITDSACIWGNTNGGIIAEEDSLEIGGKASVLFNLAPDYAGIRATGYLHLKDSAVIGFNTVDSSYGAAIGLFGSTMLMNGGQIIGNRSKVDSVKGTGMALMLSGRSTADIRNARIFNPNGDTVQQNEVFIADSFSVFHSDSTWWGDSDTSKIFVYADPSMFQLDSWVTASWSLN